MGVFFSNQSPNIAEGANNSCKRDDETKKNRSTIPPLTPIQLQKNLESIVVTTYGRVMIIGPSAAGKTSLKHALMSQTLPLPESTKLAETNQVRYEWARAVLSYWETVTDDDEYEELARLLSQVHQLAQSSIQNGAIVSLLSKPMVPRQATYIMSPFFSQASKLQKHKIKVKELKEVVEAVREKQFQRILNKAFDQAWNVNNPSERVYRESSVDPEVLMNVWDCGGQAVFLEILPAFLTSRTMFVLAFDASKSLEVKCRDVVHTDGEKEERDEQTYSTIDLLIQWLALIHAHLARYDKSHILGGFPRILMIGTHSDKLTCSEDKEKITKTIYSLCQGKAFRELILDIKFVDNTTAGGMDREDPVFQEIRDTVYQFASLELTITTQISKVLFRKLLHQYRKELNKPIVTLSEVVAIGAACRIEEEDIPSVLNFYHELGVLLYYGHIPSMQETVICDPQWLITQFAMMFSLNERGKLSHFCHWKLLHTRGILTSSLYEALWEKSQVEPQALVDLMEHFLLATPIVCNKRDHFRSSEVREYFVPSMLKVYKQTSSEKSTWKPDQYYQTAIPLYILFNTGYVVAGFFVRLIAVLAKNDHFKIAFERGVHRNRIILEFGPPNATRVNEVIITEHLETVEIVVARCVPVKGINCLHEVCRNVLQHILDASTEVLQWLPSVHIDPAFLCHCEPTKTPTSPIKIPTSASHSRDCSNTSPLTSTSNEQQQELQHDGHPSPMTVNRAPKLVPPHYVTFTADHTVKDYLKCDSLSFMMPSLEQKDWLKPSTKNCLTEPQTLPSINLYHIANKIGDSLPILANHLGMKEELDRIQTDSNTRNVADSFLQEWNQQCGDTSVLAASLHEIGLSDIVDEMKLDLPPAMQMLRKPMSKEPLKGPEILHITENINSRNMEALAAKLDMMDMYNEIVSNSNIHNKRLQFLQQWCIMNNDRAKLSQVIYDIGLQKLSEVIRCGDFAETSLPVSRRESTNNYPSTLSSIGNSSSCYLSLQEIIDCSEPLSAEGDLHLLATALDIEDDEYEALQRKFKHPRGVGVQLLKIWTNQNRGSRRELQQALISINCEKAAKLLSRSKTQTLTGRQ